MKHTKRQSRQTPKGRANVFEKKVSELDKLVPFRTCYVCDRESRELLMIAPEKFRCQGCNPGSPNWIDYWERLHPKQKTDAGQFIYDNIKKRTK